jgi:hypothetical protein
MGRAPKSAIIKGFSGIDGPISRAAASRAVEFGWLEVSNKRRFSGLD